MKTSIIPMTVAGCLFGAAILLSLSGSNTDAQETDRTPEGLQKWEYLVRRIEDRAGRRDRDTGTWHSASEETMNQLGLLGWELVDVRNDGSSTPVFYFKRLQK